jgi:hypothetical protein
MRQEVVGHLHYTKVYGYLSPMAVAYPIVLSIRIVGSVKARGKGPKLSASVLAYY